MYNSSIKFKKKRSTRISFGRFREPLGLPRRFLECISSVSGSKLTGLEGKGASKVMTWASELSIGVPISSEKGSGYV